MTCMILSRCEIEGMVEEGRSRFYGEYFLMKLNRGYIEFKYYADAIHSDLGDSGVHTLGDTSAFVKEGLYRI